MGFNGGHIRNGDTGICKGFFCRWSRRFRHMCLVGPGKSIGNNLDGDIFIVGQFTCPIFSGDDHSGITVGRMGLGTKGQYASRLCFQARHPLCSTGSDPFIFFNDDGLFSGNLYFHGDHITFLELTMVFQRVRIFLVAINRHGIGVFPGKSIFFSDIFTRLRGACLCCGVPAKSVHDPALEIGLATGPL